METVVSIFQDKLGWERRGTCLVVLLGAIAIGIPSSLGFGPWSMVQIIGMDILDFFDFISNSVLMPIVALLTCICIGHIVGPKFVEDEISLSGKFREKKMYNVTIRWIAPVCIVAILISSVMSALGIITI
jgi:NSS family neurotransmitter:Na+ symporter